MREFAAVTGCSAAQISDYENSRVAPTTDVLGRIEDAALRRTDTRRTAAGR
ncbi:hypothetical protein BH23ACT8_BH23ACT8_25610 [soil metagenome]